jgi:hypothetical protein
MSQSLIEAYLQPIASKKAGHLYQLHELNQIKNRVNCVSNITDWINTFLAKPHPDLGRSGPVCPFVPRAIQLDTIWVGVIRTQDQTMPLAQQLYETVQRYRDIFLELEPAEGELALYKAILLAFPDVDHSRFAVIDQVQKQLKPFFVEEGLMLGEFHMQTEAGGLHNPEFRPLRSPVPMLAIRFMVEADLPFLDSEEMPVELRTRYLEAYLKRFGNSSKDPRKLDQAQQHLQAMQTDAIGSAEAARIPPRSSRCPFHHGSA